MAVIEHPQTGDLGSIGAVPEVPPIASNVSASFAWRVWHERHPALLRQICEAHPYPHACKLAIEALLAETLIGTMRPLPDGATDRPAWDEWGRGYIGRAWADAPFLWAESYFYRRLLDAVGYFTAGAWFGVDPFAFLKGAELATPELAADLAALDEMDALSTRERTHALLHASLWGNRADLGFHIGVAATAGQLGETAHLIADESAAATTALYDAGPGTVCVIADNAGRELLADLLLIDHLLDKGIAGQVALHLKPHPYYTSDATVADLVACLNRLANAPGAGADAAARLRVAAGNSRLTIITHWFFCAPFSFHHMPPDLAAEIGSASVVLLKGDLNYRRLVGDCLWPPSTPFALLTDYFPAPVVALRTLKSDVVVGLDDVVAADLDADGTGWRVDGRHALVQVRN